MYWGYYFNMSNNNAFNYLINLLNKKEVEFDNFNTTSVYFIFYCNIGLFGKDAR